MGVMARRTKKWSQEMNSLHVAVYRLLQVMHMSCDAHRVLIEYLDMYEDREKDTCMHTSFHCLRFLSLHSHTWTERQIRVHSCN